MFVQYNPDALADITMDFYRATGVHLQILDSGFHPLNYRKTHGNSFCSKLQSTPTGRQACIQCDHALLTSCKKTAHAATHICHAGLVDIAVPILREQEILGYIILGQLKKTEDFSAQRPHLVDLELDTAEMERLYHALPLINDQRVHSIVAIAVMLAKYLLLANMLKPKSHQTLEKATAFIEAHLAEPLSAERIAQEIALSRSGLYKLVRSQLQCSVNDYVNLRRVMHARELLLDPELTMEQISQMTGFSNASYFSRIFKKHYGCSPMQYRKDTQNP